MSTNNVLLVQVSMRHLSSDAKKAGATLPEAQLNHVSLKQLRTLLDSAAAIAGSVVYPAEPELRITAPHGKFVVQIKAGNLNFISWSSTTKVGGVISPAQIIAAVSGEEQEVVYERSARASTGSRGVAVFGGLQLKFNMVLMIVAIVAVNSFTIWFVTRPVKTLAPKFTLMAPEPAERLLTEVAGVYETGGGERRLEIARNGGVQRIKFGKQRTVAQKQSYTVQAALAAGQSALVTDRKSLITIKDPQTLVLFGDTYQRVAR